MTIPTTLTSQTRTRHIAEAKARRKAQKDAAEAKEEDKRADARETAKRIAHGEGYSKRKGNKAYCVCVCVCFVLLLTRNSKPCNW